MKNLLPIKQEGWPQLPLLRIKKTLHLTSHPYFIIRKLRVKWDSLIDFQRNGIYYTHNIWKRDGIATLNYLLRCLQVYQCRSTNIFIKAESASQILKDIALCLRRYFGSFKINMDFLDRINLANPYSVIFVLSIRRTSIGLQQLRLKFQEDSSFRSMDQYLKMIESALVHLVNLKSLELVFDALIKIEEKRFKSFERQLFKYLVQLNDLKLDFRSSSQVDDRDLEIFGSNSFVHFSRLKTLKIVTESSQVTDEGLGKLSMNITKYLIGLKNLNLTFYRGEKVTNQGLTTLVDNIGKDLGSLESLKLDFEYCSQITDTGLRALGDIISNHKVKWQVLRLGFTSCRNVTKESKEKLREAIKFIENVSIKIV